MAMNDEILDSRQFGDVNDDLVGLEVWPVAELDLQFNNSVLRQIHYGTRSAVKSFIMIICWVWDFLSFINLNTVHDPLLTF